MKSYAEFPPMHMFNRVLQTIPHAAHLYTDLWKHRNECGNARYAKKDIKKVFLMSPTRFRSQLVALLKLDVIRFEEEEEYFFVKCSGFLK